MEHFSLGGCGVHECTCIEAFKRRADLGYRYCKQLQVINNKMLFKTVIPLKLKIKYKF